MSRADEVLNKVYNKNTISTINKDTTGREGLSSIFGESITAHRVSSFSKQFHYGMDTDLVNITEENGGEITIENNMLTCKTSTNPQSKAIIETKEYVRYVPGYDTFAYFTEIFTETSDTQIQESGLYDENNGIFIRLKNGILYLVRRRNGVDYEYETQTPFEGYTPYLGNIYRINYGYLGFANIILEVKNPNGGWGLLYDVKYPNTALETHIANTYLPARSMVYNNGATTSINIKIGSISVGMIGGNSSETERKFNVYGENEISMSNGDNLIVIFRNKTTYNNEVNKIASRLSDILIASDLNKVSAMYLEKNVTITNNPTWHDVNNNSIMEYSTDATFIPKSGKLLLPVPISKTDKFSKDFYDKNFLLYPNETAIFYLTTNGTGEISFSNNWFEMF